MKGCSFPYLHEGAGPPRAKKAPVTAETPPDFAALGAPAPLADALRERDYQNPTPVQAHVLEAADADLMVSSQTGSGKTVAFGLVIGRILLGEAATIAPGDKPRG